MQAIPEPFRAGLLFQRCGGLPGQLPQRLEVQLSPGAAIIARVTAGRRLTHLLQVLANVGHGLGASGALAVPQGLG
jgi:hypothetical protein